VIRLFASWHWLTMPSVVFFAVGFWKLQSRFQSNLWFPLLAAVNYVCQRSADYPYVGSRHLAHPVPPLTQHKVLLQRRKFVDVQNLVGHQTQFLSVFGVIVKHCLASFQHTRWWRRRVSGGDQTKRNENLKRKIILAQKWKSNESKIQKVKSWKHIRTQERGNGEEMFNWNMSFERRLL